MSNNEDFANDARKRAFALANRYTEKELSKLTGLSTTTCGRIKRGEIVTLRVVQKVIDVLEALQQ